MIYFVGGTPNTMASLKPIYYLLLLLLSRCSRVWLCETPIDGSPPGSPIPGILQARTVEWVAIFCSNAGKWKVKVKSLSHVHLLLTPWTAWSLPGSSVYGIFQARELEWGAIAFSIYYLRSMKWLTTKTVKAISFLPVSTTCQCFILANLAILACCYLLFRVVEIRGS